MRRRRIEKVAQYRVDWDGHGNVALGREHMDDAVSQGRLRNMKDVALAEASEHGEPDGDSQIRRSPIEHSATLGLGPRPVLLRLGPVPLEPSNTARGVVDQQLL